MFKILRKVITLGAVAATALAACAPSTPPPTPAPTPPPPTATPVPPTAAPTVQATISGPDSLFPPITADEWQSGPASARVTIIEYSDFQ